MKSRTCVERSPPTTRPSPPIIHPSRFPPIQFSPPITRPSPPITHPQLSAHFTFLLGHHPHRAPGIYLVIMSDVDLMLPYFQVSKTQNKLVI
ncbi:hypothetical protein E2C01_064972 [Portunus trituberculatus]|uniref:Uncharacterized protein n=1 Tax=Portunus trituberculatus TaxID=210409 RepID=A0A5B7HPV5_PORTR|nr:hypothetical protein [Portunus trituberculatus]